MRLIDADKLPWVDRVILLNKVDGDINITIAKEYTSYVNDETPTVEAIPAEWLEDLAEKLKDETDYFDKSLFLQDVIDLWKEENEISGKEK